MALKGTPSPAEDQAKETFSRLPKPEQPKEEDQGPDTTRQFNFRISEREYNRVMDYCKEEYGLSPSAAMRLIIREFVKHHNLK
ncbi:MAG: hypothetical protein K9M94_14700 [Spirochaetia bacterium]|nr:hypothetical protein [Spirochaetia bacterium]